MHFSKMHGLGNDFMIIDAVTQNVSLSLQIIRQLSDRNLGVGFDQLLIVEPPCAPDLDFHCRIFNADGTEVSQCGNGLRCFAHFVRTRNLINNHIIYISTQTRRFVLTVTKNNLVCVNMGKPVFDPQKFTFRTFGVDRSCIMYNLMEHTMLCCGVVSIGNPHCVIYVDNLDQVPVVMIGSLLRSCNILPDQVNIEFMQVLSQKHIRLRVYERGVGETQACGSGACAAAAVGIFQGYLASQVQVDFAAGQLDISWLGEGHDLYMTGPATHVYDGSIVL